MKINTLIIKNIGLISEETIQFNKPLLLFYGDIRQGKTTILNAVRWVMGGSFPSDIIKHGEKEASIELLIEDGSISRSFYVNKEGETVSRPQNIVVNNKVAGVKDLKKFLNPFLLNQNHLSDMNDTERVKFIIDLFNIDTTEIDNLIFATEKDASDLRAKIKGYGEITLEEIAKPNLEGLQSKWNELESKRRTDLAEAAKKNAQLTEEWEDKKKKALQLIIDFNNEQDEKQRIIEKSRDMLNDIWLKVKETIFEKCFDVENARRTLETLPKPETKKELFVNIQEPTYLGVNDSELKSIELNIQDSKLQQVKYDNYLKEKSRFDAKENDKARLKELEVLVKDQRHQRESKLSEINGKIEGLEANYEGLFYERTAFNMLSTSQLMKLSSELSSMYPDGFGLELIDRGESLGKSIFNFVKKAESEKRTILATIVGDKPAEVPENIGVFIVENGKIS